MFKSRSLLFHPYCCILVVTVALAGCAAKVEQRGHLPEPDQVAEIHPGTTTKDQVRKLLGTPSSVGVFDDHAWYYISRRTKQIAFLDPDVVDQEVFVVHFNKQDVVTAVDKKGLKDAHAVTPVARTTPARGRELSFLEQLIGNVGRFNSSGGGGSQ